MQHRKCVISGECSSSEGASAHGRHRETSLPPAASARRPGIGLAARCMERWIRALSPPEMTHRYWRDAGRGPCRTPTTERLQPLENAREHVRSARPVARTRRAGRSPAFRHPKKPISSPPAFAGSTLGNRRERKVLYPTELHVARKLRGGTRTRDHLVMSDESALYATNIEPRGMIGRTSIALPLSYATLRPGGIRTRDKSKYARPAPPEIPAGAERTR